MTLIINGEPSTFDAFSLPLPKLLELLEIDYPVLIEWNGAALFPREWPTVEVKNGDRVEFFRMVAGG